MEDISGFGRPEAVEEMLDSNLQFAYWCARGSGAVKDKYKCYCWVHMVVSLNRRPQRIPQNAEILIVGTPKRLPLLILGTPRSGV